MSQDLHPSSGQNFGSSGGAISPRNTFLLEINASYLMDELFQELDQQMEAEAAGAEQTSALATSEASLLEPLRYPPSTTTSLATLSEELLVPYTPLPGGLQSSNCESGLAQPEPEPRSWLQQPYPSPVNDRLLFGMACASLVLAVVLWVANQFRLQAPVPATTAAVTVPQTQVSAADRQFADYLQRSLAAIEPQATQKQAATQATTPTPTKAVPGQPQVPANLVAERIYIPVYQPQPTPASSGQVPAIAATAAAPAKPAQSASQPKASPTKAQPATVAAQPKQTLVGVLELGDRSMALVEANGSTRRVQLGETLDANGWKLTQIADQKAVLQRGGELRSIFVGEAF